MGYYTEYFSTVFKGLGASTFKIKRGARKLVREVKQEDALIYKKIINLIREHRVTKGLKDLEALKVKMKDSIERAQNLIFNVITVDRTAVAAEKEVLDALKELSREAGKFGGKNAKLLLELEEGIAKALAEETKKGIGGEREEYKLVMNIINDASKDKKNFMTNLRLSFQTLTRQTNFARWAMRAEIISEKRDIRALQAIASLIKKYVRDIKTHTNSTKPQEQLIREMKGWYSKIINSVRDFYKESYLIKKRDLLLVIKILVNANLLEMQLERWKKESFIPRDAADHLIDFLRNEVEGKLNKSFETIAQGFRILIHDSDEDYKEAVQIANQDIMAAKRAVG